MYLHKGCRIACLQSLSVLPKADVYDRKILSVWPFSQINIEVQHVE